MFNSVEEAKALLEPKVEQIKKEHFVRLLSGAEPRIINTGFVLDKKEDLEKSSDLGREIQQLVDTRLLADNIAAQHKFVETLEQSNRKKFRS